MEAVGEGEASGLGLVGSVLAESAVDGRLQHLQFEILGNLEPDDVTFNLGDNAEDAGGGHDLIASGDRPHEVAMLAGPLLLGPDHDHVQNPEHEDDGKK